MKSVCTGVVVFCPSMLFGGEGGVNLPLVYVHSAIYETYLVQWFSRNLFSIAGGYETYLV